MARQPLGQHFLSSTSWRARIFEALGPSPRDVWLEIGAGHGEMTEGLARRSRRVIAVETDPQLAAGLRVRARDWPGVEVVTADILLLNFINAVGDRFRVYGNLPYFITSPILHHLFRYADAIESAHIVIQSEVANRIVARPGRRAYGYLSVVCQYYARPEILLRIPPGAFRPQPQVASALMCMSFPGTCQSLGLSDDEGFLKFVQQCFGQKRKTLANNLRIRFTRKRIQEALEACSIEQGARAEELNLAELARLYAELSPKQTPG